MTATVQDEAAGQLTASAESQDSQRRAKLWFWTSSILFLLLLLATASPRGGAFPEFGVNWLETWLVAISWLRFLGVVPHADGTAQHSFSAISAFLQLIQVTLLSVAWNFGARLQKTLWSPFFVIPATASVAYALVMRPLYTPAVLVLTIAAIYFAAEHFAALQESEDRLKQQVETLEKMEERLNERVKKADDQFDALQRTSKDFRDQIDRADRKIRILAGDEQGEQWRKRIYRELSQEGGGWTGRMRYWEIDRLFVEKVDEVFQQFPVEDHTDFGPYLSVFVEAFSRYANSAAASSSAEPTLYKALTQATHWNLGPEREQLRRAPRTTGIRLMFDPRPAGTPGVEELLDLAGLMFQLVVFEIVNREARVFRRQSDAPLGDMNTVLRQARFARIRVGYSTPWIHVVNDNVYEVENWRSEIGEAPAYGTTVIHDFRKRRPDVATALARHYKSTLSRDLSMGGSGEAFVASELLTLFEGLAGEAGGPLVARLDKIRSICRADWARLRTDWADADQFARFFMLLVVAFVRIVCESRDWSREFDGVPIHAQRGYAKDLPNNKEEAFVKPLLRAVVS